MKHLIFTTNFLAWSLWGLGMLIFTAGLGVMFFTDKAYLEFPLTILLIPLLTFYYFKLWQRET